MAHVVHKSIFLKASPAEVWDALTNPQKTKRYFFNCEVFSTWKPGDAIVFKGRIFWIFPIALRGTVEKAEPRKLLQYTLLNHSGEGGSRSRVTDVLTPQNGGTLLEITDNVGAGEGAGKRRKKSEKGWDKVLTGLKKLLEKK
jgi:uncharacterized protein YndB with AHSA1/START domain